MYWKELQQRTENRQCSNTCKDNQALPSVNSFNNLFSSSNKPKRALPVATVKYNAPTTQVQPVGDPNKKNREKLTKDQVAQKAKAYDFLQDDM